MDMHASFHHFDTDRSGTLEKQEVQRALEHSGAPLLWAYSNVPATCLLSCSVFHRTRLPLPSSCGCSPKSHSAAHTRGVHGRQQCVILRQWQARGAQWLRGRARAGFHLDQHAFGAAFGAFDPDRNGKLATPEYVALTVFCKNTAAMFHAFDPKSSGHVGLDYNQFVYAASNCK